MITRTDVFEIEGMSIDLSRAIDSWCSSVEKDGNRIVSISHTAVGVTTTTRGFARYSVLIAYTKDE